MATRSKKTKNEVKKVFSKKKRLLIILIFLLVFMPLTLNALETKVTPQLTFIGFEEFEDEVVTVVNYGDQDKHLNIGDTIGDRKLVDMNFDENYITFKTNGLTSTLKRGHSFHRVFVQSWTPRVEEDSEEVEPERVDINTASYNRLQDIIHIGPVRANEIFSLRQEEPFNSVDDLTRVRGIAEVRLQDIKDQGIATVEQVIATVEEEEPEPEPETVNINTASFNRLRDIIHIDQVRARQIIRLREEEPFNSIDDLTEVTGINGDGIRLQEIKDEGIAIVN